MSDQQGKPGLVQMVIGALLAIAGLVIGLLPQGDCGSAFAPAARTGDQFADFLSAGTNQLQTPRIFAFAFIVIGVIALVVGAARLSRGPEPS